MKNIAFLYASEGTGHKAAAENMREWFSDIRPDGSSICIDVLDVLPRWLHALVSQGYLVIARHATAVWGMLYWGSDRPSPQASLFDGIHSLLCRLYLPRIEKAVIDSGAEAAVFTHYFGAAIFAERNIAEIPVFYVNTDFITHRFQRIGPFKASFVASSEAVRQYREEGLDRVFNTGIPISKKYDSLISKKTARQRLGLDPLKLTVLVTGGGIGAGPVVDIADSLSKEKDIQTLVVCGNNTRLFKKLSSRFSGSENIRIMSFVDNMHECYCASDLAVMKPGGLSLSEALSVKLPLLLMEPIPGQEELNMDLLCASGAAHRLKDRRRAAKEVLNLLKNKEKLDKITKGMERYSRPRAAAEILEIIADCTRR